MLWRETDTIEFHFPLKTLNGKRIQHYGQHQIQLFNKTHAKSQEDKWAATWQNQRNDCAPSEDSDQPGHPPSLIRVFAVRMKKAWVLSFPLSAQRRLWSDWVDAQADLSLRWADTHFVGFVVRRLNCFQADCHIDYAEQSQNKGCGQTESRQTTTVILHHNRIRPPTESHMTIKRNPNITGYYTRRLGQRD